MRSLKALLLGLALALVVPGSLPACPACSEAIANSNGGDDGDVSDFPRAMNQSIYLMLAVPYTSFAVVAFLIYRGVKKNAEYLAALERASAAGAPSEA